MRADMAKVVTERPRGGSRFCPSPKLRWDHDPEPRKAVGLRRRVKEHVGWDAKWDLWGSRASNFGSVKPLARFLERRVGRRWDSVYREICTQLDSRKTQTWLARRRLCDLVVFVARGRRGELMGEGKPLSPRHYNAFWRRHCYYVDPDDGLLKDHARFWRDHQKEMRQ